MILVDSNVLLYAVNDEAQSHTIALNVLEEVVGGDVWAFSWNLGYEFFRVSTHPRIFSKPLRPEDALDFIRNITDQPSCRIIQETAEHMELAVKCSKETRRLQGNLLHDFHTAVLMREHGIREILTFDRDFLAFPWVSVKEPR